MVEKLRQVRSPTLPRESTLKGPLITSHKRGYAGRKLGEATSLICHFGVGSQISRFENAKETNPSATQGSLQVSTWLPLRKSCAMYR